MFYDLGGNPNGFTAFFCVRAVSKYGTLYIYMLMRNMIDILIDQADGMMYYDFCRLFRVLQWNV
nr:MAG TPA: hypothetical protein [Caudoviricetes sp.]DAI63993.1 MAG TPA: hypothetical protein [Caudoviricetes sp.]